MKYLKIIACLWLLAGAVLASAGLFLQPHPADVAVVLGNTVDRDGRPSPRLAARLDRAYQCYEQRQCRILFVSGGIEASGADEAMAMRAYLVRLGVPSDSIVVDRAGNDTWSTARNASEFMRNHGWTSAVVVTQYFHLPRTILALRRFGVRSVSGAYPPFWEVRDLYSIAREVPALVWYSIRPI
ncbi:YdcF family protein [Paraburkholderia elongata]|uniref:YdcF family protein n=1 Tax=Paraburkholderia elongata TaxID=2675747 RepID=A0A972SMB4_9BURK|nr:YdcF family protein [Paraburkholderia elongata]NPT59982.1 YdcF family protein [Paraburkholderia elongata]